MVVWVLRGGPFIAFRERPPLMGRGGGRHCSPSLFWAVRRGVGGCFACPAALTSLQGRGEARRGWTAWARRELPTRGRDGHCAARRVA